MSRAPRTARAELPKGEQARHVPVLLAEVLAALSLDRPGLAVDGTFGAGGYTRALLEAGPEVRVIAIDRDPTAIRGGADLVTASGGRLRLVQGRFGDLDTLIADQDEAQADWIVLDIGVSSMQIDEAQRGFSFRQDGPLDMRMGGEGPSAADLVNGEEETTLADILYHFGEERRSRAVARAIVEGGG
ncbi:16S rRNA (cytosine(1402)-N(4))-methyltransferase, partial [Methylorubrum extorquens]